MHEPSLNAVVLIGEKATTNPADIFSSKQFGELLAGLREQYDYINTNCQLGQYDPSLSLKWDEALRIWRQLWCLWRVLRKLKWPNTRHYEANKAPLFPTNFAHRFYLLT